MNPDNVEYEKRKKFPVMNSLFQGFKKKSSSKNSYIKMPDLFKLDYKLLKSGASIYSFLHLPSRLEQCSNTEGVQLNDYWMPGRNSDKMEVFCLV